MTDTELAATCGWEAPVAAVPPLPEQRVLQLLTQQAAEYRFADGCHILVTQLGDLLKCEHVSLGVLTGHRAKLIAVSAAAKHAAQTPTATAVRRLIEAALGSTCDKSATSTAQDDVPDRQQYASEVCQVTQTEAVCCVPLVLADAKPLGALVLAGSRAVMESRDTQAVLQHLAPVLAGQLARWSHMEMGWFGRWRGRLQNRSRHLALLVAASVLAAVTLMVPVTYRVGCTCVAEPVTRQFVVAPFEGRLDRAFVQVGDIVQRGQVVARLADRELRLELESVEAERHREEKKSDVARASGDVAQSQIAGYEAQRLDQQAAILRHRIEHLELRSPIDGMVIYGDLDKSIGAPLTTGQTLLEISPLKEMIVEIEIPQHQFPYVRAGMPVRVTLDPFPNRDWHAELQSVAPRAELRDDDSVFIGEVRLDNPEGRIKPGMRGRVKILSERRSIGWILFHRFAASLRWKAAMLLGGK